MKDLVLPMTVARELDLESRAGKTTCQYAVDTTYQDTGRRAIHCQVSDDSYCVSPDAPVLTRDLRWVPAGDLVAGDALWAFDEEPGEDGRDGRGHRSRRRWRKAVVTATGRAVLSSYEVLTEDGRRLVVSAGHKWLRHDHTGRHWVRTDELRPGHSVVRICDTWEQEDSWEAGWLAGMMDGEGSLAGGKRGKHRQLSITQKEGAVMDELRRLFAEHGWTTRSYVHKRTNSLCSVIYLCGGVSALMACLGRYRPARLLAKFDIEGQGLHGIRTKVASLRPVGDVENVTLATSSRTFVCGGFAAHNSVADNPHVATAFCCGDYTTCPVFGKTLEGGEAIERWRREMEQRKQDRITRRQIANGTRFDDRGLESELRDRGEVEPE